MSASSPALRARRLKWLAVVGAVLLLAGVFVFCHTALRTSRWMVEAISRSPEEVENESVESAERWLALIASIEREAFFARTLTSLGAGALGGALLILVVTTWWRFTMRTLLCVMLYIAVIIGVPLGFVRPRLQNPRISVHPADYVVGLGQLRPYANAKYESDPWTNNGPVSRGGSTLIDRTSVLVALAAFIVPLILSRWPAGSRPRGGSAGVE